MSINQVKSLETIFLNMVYSILDKNIENMKEDINEMESISDENKEQICITIRQSIPDKNTLMKWMAEPLLEKHSVKDLPNHILKIRKKTHAISDKEIIKNIVENEIENGTTIN